MKSFRNIRVIPVVVFAVCCLAVLKVAGLVIDGGYVFDYDPKRTQSSWAQDNLNFPGGKDASRVPKEDGDITGSVHGAPAEKKEEPKPEAPDTKSDGMVLHPEENNQSARSWSGCRRAGRRSRPVSARSTSARAS